jgi:hypothetical protein
VSRRVEKCRRQALPVEIIRDNKLPAADDLLRAKRRRIGTAD